MSEAIEKNSQDQQEAIRAARNAYQREWRRKNPEKVKAAQVRFYSRRLKKMTEASNAPDQE